LLKGWAFALYMYQKNQIVKCSKIFTTSFNFFNLRLTLSIV
jgi:hypothetical protein